MWTSEQRKGRITQPHLRNNQVYFLSTESYQQAAAAETESVLLLPALRGLLSELTLKLYVLSARAHALAMCLRFLRHGVIKSQQYYQSCSSLSLTVFALMEPFFHVLKKFTFSCSTSGFSGRFWSAHTAFFMLLLSNVDHLFPERKTWFYKTLEWVITYFGYFLKYI